MIYFGHFLRIVNTTQLVSTAQYVRTVSMAMQEMELRMIARNAHVKHPKRPRKSIKACVSHIHT